MRRGEDKTELIYAKSKEARLRLKVARSLTSCFDSAAMAAATCFICLPEGMKIIDKQEV